MKLILTIVFLFSIFFGLVVFQFRKNRALFGKIALFGNLDNDSDDKENKADDKENKADEKLINDYNLILDNLSKCKYNQKQYYQEINNLRNILSREYTSHITSFKKCDTKTPKLANKFKKLYKLYNGKDIGDEEIKNLLKLK